MDFALDDDQQLIVETVRRFSDRDLREDALEHDELLEPGGASRARQIDLRHAAGRDLAQDLVLPDARSPRQLVLRSLARLWLAHAMKMVTRLAPGRDVGGSPQ